MKKEAKFGLAFVVIMLIGYLAMSFVFQSVNPELWGRVARFAYIFIGGILSLYLSFIYSTES